MKLLTKTKTMDLLGIGRKRLDSMLKLGQLKCVRCGNNYLIPDWSIEECLKHTENPIGLSYEEKSIKHTSRQSSTDKEYSFEKARIQATERKLKNTPLNAITKSLSKPNTAPTLVN